MVQHWICFRVPPCSLGGWGGGDRQTKSKQIRNKIISDKDKGNKEIKQRVTAEIYRMNSQPCKFKKNSIASRGNNTCKGPGADARLSCLRSWKEVWPQWLSG